MELDAMEVECDEASAPRGASKRRRKKNACTPVVSTGNGGVNVEEKGSAPRVAADSSRVPKDAGGLKSALKGANEPPNVDPTPPVHVEERPRDRSLRDEVNSVAHGLARKPKNPYCHVCTQTRTRQARHPAGAFDRETKEWGI